MFVELLFDDESLEELLVVLEVSATLPRELVEQRLDLFRVAVIAHDKGDGDQTWQGGEGRPRAIVVDGEVMHFSNRCDGGSGGFGVFNFRWTFVVFFNHVCHKFYI